MFGIIPYRVPAGMRNALRGVRLGLGAAQALSVAQIVASAAAAYGVDAALATAVAQRESGLNPSAYNIASGATGVMQLLPSTFASMGVGSNIWDATQNVNAGVKYLGILLNQFGGDVAKAVAAYDWGPGNLSNDISQNGDNWLAFAPLETQNYVAALTGQTPASQAAQASQAAAADQSITTIDATTGEVVPNVDISQLPQVTEAGIVPALTLPGGFAIDWTDPTTLGILAIGGWLAWQVLSDL